MKLTVEEEGILAGHQGLAKKKAMELLVKIGDLYGAERLIPISRGHVLTSLINFHDAGMQVVEGFSMAGGKYSVPTTIDPVSMSFEGTDMSANCVVHRGRGVTSLKARGEAIVTKQPFMFSLGLDPKTGKVIDQRHELYGRGRFWSSPTRSVPRVRACGCWRRPASGMPPCPRNGRG